MLSRFHTACKRQIQQNSKHCITEQKAPKSTRNSHPTPPNLVGPQRLLSDTSTKVLSTQRKVPNPHAALTNHPKLFRTHPDGSGHRRTTTKTDKTDSETLQRQLSAGKLFRKKHFRQSSNFNKHNAQIFRHLSEHQRGEKCKKHAR